MNQASRLLFFAIAVALATGISYVVYLKLTRPTVVVAKERVQTVTQIAVAVRDLKRGDKITATDVKLAGYLQDSLPKGTFSDLRKVIGRIVVSPVGSTAPVLDAELAPTSLTKGGMAAIIGQDKRAMAVKVDNVIGVAGFLQPGHTVDVLVSIDKNGRRNNQVAKTVLENIPVLSVGTQAEVSTDKKVRNVTVVTLEVSLEEGEKLALAVNQGRIKLALRGYSDIAPVLTRGITGASLLQSYSSHVFKPVRKEKKKQVARFARARPHLVMEMMNGNDVKRVTLDH